MFKFATSTPVGVSSIGVGSREGKSDRFEGDGTRLVRTTEKISIEHHLPHLDLTDLTSCVASSQVMVYIDNEGAKFAWIRGYSDSFAISLNCHLVQLDHFLGPSLLLSAPIQTVITNPQDRENLPLPNAITRMISCY
jgi:hypothetical protein